MNDSHIPPPLPDGSTDSPPPLPPMPPRPAASDPDRALFQVTEQTRTYPCENCGAQLVFDPTTQNLLCLSCGRSHAIVLDPARRVVEHDLASTMTQLRGLLAAAPPATTSDSEREIVCQSCGGRTTFTGTLTATRCPYCATPIQRDDIHAAPTRLPVDGILPFQVDDTHGREVIEKWINSRWFAPTEFKKYREVGAFTSLYAAYFTYDADTTTSYTGMRGDNYTVTTGSGDNRRTETRTRWSHRSGVVGNNFDDVAVLANTGFDTERVHELEPWPTGQATPFSPEFIAGHLCRTYDLDADQCFPVAQGRINAGIDAAIRRDIGGDHQRINNKDTRYNSLTFKHVLLPIWLLTVIYAGTPFQVFINGVTGEVQGQRPWSKVKIAFAVLAALIVIIAIVAAWAAWA
ncbi:hypothetical protein DFR67_101545 [Williamsia limnetica]|uniref:LSD1 subclass zinc finger protein n=1 Tax=Williamsia limnetica TaxID=882452 RepID=A0A318RQG5_WILLI|nr:hypothetical protein [Williamsia limnetica]PYE21147.1 hypothetical protein DFR67_101545 [Williamsia limnetica]